MKLLLVLMTGVLVGFISAGTLLAENGSAHADVTNPTLYVRADPAVGRYFTDSAGMTLYRFTKDTAANESTCYDQCAANWPPFVASEPFALPLDVDGELSLVQRTDGTTQVAYNGMPLYYFAGDAAVGDIDGQGVGDVWWVVAPGTNMGAARPAGTPAATGIGTPAAAGVVTVTLTDYAIESSAATLQAGQEYTFSITNNGVAMHEFLIEVTGAQDEPLEANDEEAEAEDIAPGETKMLTWVFGEPGRYQFTCHIPGHYPAGMALNITVV